VDLASHVSIPVQPDFARLRTLVPLAICAALVCLDLDQALQCLAVLLRAIGGGIGPPRHCVIPGCAQGDRGGVQCVVSRDWAKTKSRCLFGRVRLWYGKSRRAWYKSEGRPNRWAWRCSHSKEHVGF
jgi:hypothetical protein